MVSGAVLWMLTAAPYSDTAAVAERCAMFNLPTGYAGYDGGRYPSCQDVNALLHILERLRTVAWAYVASGLVATASALAIPRLRSP